MENNVETPARTVVRRVRRTRRCWERYRRRYEGVRLKNGNGGILARRGAVTVRLGGGE